MSRIASPLPPIWHRAGVIGFGMALLWFVGDYQWFSTESLSRWTLLYLLMGVSTSLCMAATFFCYERWHRPRSARGDLIGQFLATMLALIPGVAVPALIDGYLSEEPVIFAELWSFFLYGAITAAMFLLHYSNRKSLADLMELRAKTAEARYDLLKTQMQPHFLFNSLNSLAELIPQAPEAAEEMAQKLSDLYKQILLNSESKTATLESEVAIARRYLEIERLRFEDRLRFEFSIPVDAARIQVPSLLLQTLVENAVKHGIANCVEGGALSLVVTRTGKGWYRMQLTNTGEPYRAVASGTGLSNTLSRLELLYGDRHDFRLYTDEQNRTVVSFQFSGESHA